MRLARLSIPFSPSSVCGRKRWLRREPPVSAMSIFERDLVTAVGPFRSAPWAGDAPSDIGASACLPSALAPVLRPK